MTRRVLSVLLLLAAHLVAAATAHAQTPWTRLAQPDGGSIDIPASWVVVRMADPAALGADGATEQRLASARGVYDGIPVVLSVSRRTLTATDPGELMRRALEQHLAKFDESRMLRSPAIDAPPGMRAACSLAGFRSGDTWSNICQLVLWNEQAASILTITSRATLEPAFAAVRLEILSRWRPSRSFVDRRGMAPPERTPTEVRFAEGGTIALPADWLVIEQDAETTTFEYGDAGRQQQLDEQQLLNVRRYHAERAVPDTIQLYRARPQLAGEAARVTLERDLPRIARATADGLLAAWSEAPGSPDATIIGANPIEIRLPRAAIGLSATVLLWTTDGECMTAVSMSESPELARTNAFELRELYRSSERRAEGAEAPQDIAASSGPPTESMAPHEPRGHRVDIAHRIGRDFGLALSTLLVLGGVPIVLAMFGRRWCLAGVALTLLIAALMAHGAGSEATYRLQLASNSDGEAAGNSLRSISQGGFLAIPLFTFGESVGIVTRSTMPELAARAVEGDSVARLVMVTVLSIGLFVAVIAPLGFRKLVFRQRMDRWSTAVLLGILWWLACVLCLSVCESVNSQHVACTIGAISIVLLHAPREGILMIRPRSGQP